MPRRVPLFALAVAIAVLSSQADGQAPRPPLNIVFRRLDADADGKLTSTEFGKFATIAPRMKDNPKAADFIFRRLDTDSDGQLTLTEFQKLAEIGPRPGAPKKSSTVPDRKIAPQSTQVAEKPPTAEEIAFFEKKVRPVLVAKCYSCHSANAEKLKGGLTLDTREGLRKGGDSGPTIVPGNPKRSLLIQALHGSNDAAQMPPKEKLSADVIADFETWIATGAADPRDGAATRKAGALDIASGKQHWAFQPVQKPAVPQVNPPATTPIDAFVQTKLEEKKLIPNGPADQRTLIRRVYFDLIGLPPTPEQVERFVADTSPKALEKVVDELLASQHFGERWGRHWLDVARYAESSGKEQNILYPLAWRYRDYVIASFNADTPYDRFLREQLAGDTLPARNDTEKAAHLIATGYLAVGPKSHNERNATQFFLDLADEQIDAFSQGMLGLTVACARCHDHKFDPIPQADYYALAGIFTSTDTRFGTPPILIARQSAPSVDLPAAANVSAGITLTQYERDQLARQLDFLKKRREEAFAAARKDGQPPVQLVVLTTQIGILEKQLSNYSADGTPRKQAMAALDRSSPRDSPLYARGEPDKPGDVVPRGFLQVLSTGHDPKIRTGSGRKELADWVASPDNPLTARVMVNRIWHHLFGRGLVSTPDNFGTTGQPPSHPELLDYLAARFVEDGWSVKKLIRSVVLTETYRRSSAAHARNAATDPDNVYLWQASKRRLDAEVIRDAMLSVAGVLDPKPGTGSPVSKFEGPAQALQRLGGNDRLFDTPHRSVYLPIVRNNLPEPLELFDFAEPSLVTGARETTSVPGQALYLMNNSHVLKLSEAMAERLATKASPTERIDAGFRLAFGRPPTPAEVSSAETFVTRFRQSATEKAAWAAFAQALFAAAEFRHVD